jgi:hypothetical protein
VPAINKVAERQRDFKDAFELGRLCHALRKKKQVKQPNKKKRARMTLSRAAENKKYS